MVRTRAPDPIGIEPEDLGGGRFGVQLSGDLLFSRAGDLLQRLREVIPDGARDVRIDLSRVSSLDGGTTALMFLLRGELLGHGMRLRFDGAQDDVRAILELYDDADCQPCLQAAPTRIGTLDQIGRNAWSYGKDLRGVFEFVGSVAAGTLRTLRRPSFLNWSDLPRLMERTGADALPIVALISFLVGLVTAYMAASQLTKMGADVFIADLVALATVRELGPLMTAILVAGRSGAGFASELATMKVNEEVDALRTMDLDPIGFLVLPRILALVLMMPLLTLFADLVSIGGGLVIAVFEMDLTVATYVTRCHGALSIWHVSAGLIMSLCYGVTIGVIACHRGLRTTGGALGVGRSTTSAVVTSLFYIVIITSGLTVLFMQWEM